MARTSAASGSGRTPDAVAPNRSRAAATAESAEGGAERAGGVRVQAWAETPWAARATAAVATPRVAGPPGLADLDRQEDLVARGEGGDQVGSRDLDPPSRGVEEQEAGPVLLPSGHGNDLPAEGGYPRNGGGPGCRSEAAAATHPAAAKARGVQETQAAETAGMIPCHAANAPGFKEMAAPAPAANAAAATCICLEFLKKEPEIERFFQY